MNNENGDSLAVKLRTLRAKHNLTQAQVAQSLGISQQTYSNYEKKDTAIYSKILKAVCKLYDVSADYLLGITTAETGADDLAFSAQDDEKIVSLFKDFYKKVKTQTENKDGDSDDPV